MNMRAREAWRVLLALLWLPNAALADELIFKNGDRLTGVVVGLTKG